jgi:hypothetical protein
VTDSVWLGDRHQGSLSRDPKGLQGPEGISFAQRGAGMATLSSSQFPATGSAFASISPVSPDLNDCLSSLICHGRTYVFVVLSYCAVM